MLLFRLVLLLIFIVYSCIGVVHEYNERTREIVWRLHNHFAFTPAHIAYGTGISRRTVRRILRDVTTYGTFETRTTIARLTGNYVRGRRRQISNNALELMIGLWHIDSSLYISEIQTILAHLFGEYYSVSCLRYWVIKLRYSRKIVWNVSYSIPFLYSISFSLNKLLCPIVCFKTLDLDCN